MDALFNILMLESRIPSFLNGQAERFFKISKDVLKVNKIARKNLKEIKKLLKSYGYKNIRTKGVFSIYGDLRPLAVEAGFGKWGDDGIIENEKYGTNFLISAVFYK